MKCPLNYNQAGFELHCILMWDWLLFAIIKHCTLKLPINSVNVVWIHELKTSVLFSCRYSSLREFH